jgi:hypothetical protein
VRGAASEVTSIATRMLRSDAFGVGVGALMPI